MIICNGIITGFMGGSSQLGRQPRAPPPSSRPRHLSNHLLIFVRSLFCCFICFSIFVVNCCLSYSLVSPALWVCTRVCGGTYGAQGYGGVRMCGQGYLGYRKKAIQRK